ncbi:MAG: TIGR00341 family protein [Rhodothermales bacterium]
MPASPDPTVDPAAVDSAVEAEDANEESAIEEAAREKFGLRRWDRPALYVETAEAATDTDLPFWMVLMLSGAIATLGLALDATAVVIGAMLVAPLMGPLLGLSLALAVGDGRLAVQTGLTIFLGAVGVIAVAALLTVLLPFQEVTPEIASRTRPTTLDLGIAVFSGLAGAVVTVSRERRLSASIPGVAIAVALIPPLGVAGFGIGTGWQWSLVHGSLLLFGANLGGIVLSGMAAFLLVGMHRDDVLDRARRWHREADLPGLAGRISRMRLFSGLRVFDSPWMRVALVFAFVAAVAFPLTSSLTQVLREARITRALDAAASALQADGDAAVLSRSVRIGETTSRVQFRIAASEWIGERDRVRIERDASAAAGEPITLALDQLIASNGDLPSLTDPVSSSASSSIDPSPAATLDRLDRQVTNALRNLALPDGVEPLGAEVVVGSGPARLLVTYAAARPLSAEAETMIARQAAAALRLDADAVATEAVATRPYALPVDSARTAAWRDLLGRFPRLRLVVTADSATADSVRRALLAGGTPDDQVIARVGAPPRIHLVLPDDPPDDAP